MTKEMESLLIYDSKIDNDIESIKLKSIDDDKKENLIDIQNTFKRINEKEIQKQSVIDYNTGLENGNISELKFEL